MAAPGPFNPAMLTAARESRRMTQSALAERSGVAQGTISKMEHGRGPASLDLLDKLADALGYRSSLFFEPFVSAPIFRHRKRQSLSPVDLRAIEATIRIFRVQASSLMRSVQLPDVRVPEIDLEGDATRPWEAAREVRMRWGVPAGRVENMASLLESAGVIVVRFDFGSRFIDGVSAYDSFDPSIPPMVFLNSRSPAERTRFTCAHELAHLVLHYHRDAHASETWEQEADDFASEFLMPAAEIKGFLGGLTLDALASLKPRWKVSMAALIQRAVRLEKISESHAKRLWIQMAKLGYKTREPMELPAEEPTIFRDMVRFHVDQLGYSDDDAASAVHLPTQAFVSQYRGSESKLRLVPAC